MGIKEFKMPDIGEGVAEGEIVSWKVTAGERVREEQDFVEVMTDKATVTITVPYDGVIKELRFGEGETVPVETVIAVIETGEAASAEPAHVVEAAHGAASQGVAVAVTRASPGKVIAAPATRRRAREVGVDLSSVSGTGPGGRVTNEDLKDFLDREKTVPATPDRHVPAVSKAMPRQPGQEERIPFRGVRKKISEAMTRSKFTATHFTIVEDLDVTELVKLRNEVKERYAEQGVRVTYLPFIMKAVVAGLRAYPWLNSSLDESTEEVVLKRYYNLGVATDTPGGLIVPVIKDVDRKSIVQIATQLQELADRTRGGEVRAEELKGGTFSITNAGKIGGLLATPIINFPEVAILGVHRIQKTPRVVGGEIRIRDVMYLSVSIDHRIVDGADGARFLNLVKSCLEDPKKLLVEA
ncbi:MAG: dihydrolipoamide acetyltransferase family protein [Planctomycetota bacterium]